MNNTTRREAEKQSVLAAYNNWLTERAGLAERDGSLTDPVSSGDWEASDDEGITLLHDFATLAQLPPEEES